MRDTQVNSDGPARSKWDLIRVRFNPYGNKPAVGLSVHRCSQYAASQLRDPLFCSKPAEPRKLYPSFVGRNIAGQSKRVTSVAFSLETRKPYPLVSAVFSGLDGIEKPAIGFVKVT